MYNKNIIQQYERALKDPSILHVDTYNFKNMTVNSQTNIAKDVFKIVWTVSKNNIHDIFI